LLFSLRCLLPALRHFYLRHRGRFCALRGGSTSLFGGPLRGQRVPRCGRGQGHSRFPRCRGVREPPPEISIGSGLCPELEGPAGVGRSIVAGGDVLDVVPRFLFFSFLGWGWVGAMPVFPFLIPPLGGLQARPPIRWLADLPAAWHIVQCACSVQSRAT